MSPVAQEQQKNLKVLGILFGALVMLIALAGWYLYTGVELPPYEMRHYYTSSTGYAPPLSQSPSPAGTVSRGSVILQEPLSTNAPATSGPDRAATPPEADSVQNPTPPDSASMTFGKAQFDANCRMCHGAPNESVGPVGEAYSPRPPDLRTRVRLHSDGALFYVITNGIRSTPTPETARYLPDLWHSFRDLMAPRERWATVTYMRRTYEK